MQAEFDKRLALQEETVDRELKKEVEKYKYEVEEIKEKLSQMVRENKRVVENLKKQLAEKENSTEEQRKQVEAAVFENRVTCIELEIKLERKDQRIKFLKNLHCLR